MRPPLVESMWQYCQYTSDKSINKQFRFAERRIHVYHSFTSV